MNKTLVFGGSLKPERYSNKAIKMLRGHDIDTVSYGLREGAVEDVSVDNELIEYENIHTISLYMNPKRQVDFYEYLIGLSPKRIIFNPGTENTELAKLAIANDIAVINACTLVLLSTNQY